MFDRDRWQEIWQTITHNKMRSLMTAFGVFWGIFMLVIMAGSGYGLENGVLNGVQDFAQNSAYFFTYQTSEPYKGFKKGRWWNLQSEDREVLMQNIPELRIVAPIIFGNMSNASRGEKNGDYYIKGLHPEYNKIDPQLIVKGRYINDIDVSDKRKVCVIGSKVYKELFKPEEDPVGALIKVSGLYYTVVGVNEPLTEINVGGQAEESIIFPYSVLQQQHNRGNEVDCFAITAVDEVPIGDLEEQIGMILKKRHTVSPTDPSAVQNFNVEKQFKMFNYLFLGIRSLIWIVGLGTLLAGVVGVSNIMMVTVRERTKEIGIRRALGAKPRTILSQIMSESLLLTILAGGVGMCAGVGLLALVSNVLPKGEETFFMNPQVTFFMAMVAMIVLLVSGIFAGMIPAWRALQIKAIDAIREE